tara:strand:- start:102 stop:416 length:315 start_codon:yes stop_codon:yes gene_type:complete
VLVELVVKNQATVVVVVLIQFLIQSQRLVVEVVDQVIQEVVEMEDQVVVKDIVQVVHLLDQVILLQQLLLKEILVVQELCQFQEDLVVAVVEPEQLEITDQVRV